MESVRFLASFIALEFEPRTYLPALTACVTREQGDLYVPEAEAIPCNVEVHAKEPSKEYPVMQREACYACPKAPSAQSVVPATDPLPASLLHGPPFPTLFDVDVDDEPDTEVYRSLAKVESPFPTLFCLDLDECSS